MKQFIIVFFITLSSFCFGQENRCFYNFASAFKKIDSVECLSIICSDMNIFETDGCDSLPHDIGVFRNLTDLYVMESSIKSLPISINQLSRLKVLGLNYLYNFDYETELCKLVGLDSLEYLGLRRARIKTLPDCIGKINSLQYIDISHNKDLDMQSTFKLFNKLQNLESLDLSGIDSLKVLPKEIIEIKQLNNLELNFLKNLDHKTSFERISPLKIESLSLTNNVLKRLPTTITQLKYLTYINLSENIFDSIPSEIFELTDLQYIKIQHNKLSLKTIGREISKLKKLEKINLGGNIQLNGIEAIISLVKLPNLKEIDFFDCRLDSIPNELSDFPALEILNLDRNPNIDFSDLFLKLSNVKTLKHLDISDNKLTTLPKEIGLLTSLEYLVIGQNAISSLPEEFFDLANLKVLNIYGNYDSKISDIELQRIQERMPNCEIIDRWVFRD